MNTSSVLKPITLGHSQHGKSTVAGYLFLQLAKEHLPEQEYNRLYDLVTRNVFQCMANFGYKKNLKYALTIV